MIRVILEAPFGKRVDGTTASPEEIERNVEYARRAMRDCFRRGEAPYASHLLYPQIYDDAKPEERLAGMEAGFAWGEEAQVAVVYADYGITPGMSEGIARHRKCMPVEQRMIGICICSPFKMAGVDPAQSSAAPPPPCTVHDQ